MNPTKAKALIPEAAKEAGVSEILVQDVVDFYYSTVRKKIESLQYPTLFLHSLGTLRLSRKKLHYRITSLEKDLVSNEQESFKKVIKFNLTREELDLKKRAMEICNNYYEPIYEKRNKNLESKGSDTGRDKEQLIQD